MSKHLTAVVSGVAALALAANAPPPSLCQQAHAVLPTLACAESTNGVALAGDAGRAQRLLELADAGVGRFREYFGRQALRYAVAEGPDALVPRDKVAALRAAGFKVVLPWLSEKLYRDQVEQSIRRGIAAQMQGRPQAEIDAVVAQALARQTDQGVRAKIELAAVSHELGHYWYWQGYWPDAPLGEEKHYGGPSPDWMDETAAVLMEAPSSFDDRVMQFAKRYRDYRAEPQKASESTRLMLDLIHFFAETHPAQEQVKALNRQTGNDAPNGSVRVISGDEARKIAEGGLRFYLQSAVAAQYLIDRSGNRQVFARIAEAFARGQTMEQWLAGDEPKGKLPRDLKALQADWLNWLDQRFPAEPAKATT